MSSVEEFKVEVQEVPRRVRPRIRLRDVGTRGPLVEQAVDRILNVKPQVTVAAFQSSI